MRIVIVAASLFFLAALFMLMMPNSSLRSPASQDFTLQGPQLAALSQALAKEFRKISAANTETKEPEEQLQTQTTRKIPAISEIRRRFRPDKQNYLAIESCLPGATAPADTCGPGGLKNSVVGWHKFVYSHAPRILSLPLNSNELQGISISHPLLNQEFSSFTNFSQKIFQQIVKDTKAFYPDYFESFEGNEKGEDSSTSSSSSSSSSPPPVPDCSPSVYKELSKSEDILKTFQSSWLFSPADIERLEYPNYMNRINRLWNPPIQYNLLEEPPAFYPTFNKCRLLPFDFPMTFRCLKNRRILYAGDSIIRYQFMDMVYALEFEQAAYPYPLQFPSEPVASPENRRFDPIPAFSAHQELGNYVRARFPGWNSEWREYFEYVEQITSGRMFNHDAEKSTQNPTEWTRGAHLLYTSEKYNFSIAYFYLPDVTAGAYNLDAVRKGMDILFGPGNDADIYFHNTGIWPDEYNPVQIEDFYRDFSSKFPNTHLIRKLTCFFIPNHASRSTFQEAIDLETNLFLPLVRKYGHSFLDFRSITVPLEGTKFAYDGVHFFAFVYQALNRALIQRICEKDNFVKEFE